MFSKALKWILWGPPPPPPSRDELLETPWRKIYDDSDFRRTAEYLKDHIRRHNQRRLNIVLIGHTGAGKSSLINAIFSISRGRIVNKVTTKGDDLGGIGSFHFVGLQSKEGDMFRQVYIFDTMGFTGLLGEDDKGIKNEDLKAVCEGRVTCGHKFNEDTVSGKETENRPHCVIFVVGAEEMDSLSSQDDSVLQKKLSSLNKLVPPDAARLAIITKMDLVCDSISKDIKTIYRSRKAQTLVKKVKNTFGVNPNETFPIVNFVEEMEVDEEKSVPILYALKFALDFALDRSEDREDGVVYRRQ